MIAPPRRLAIVAEPALAESAFEVAALDRFRAAAAARGLEPHIVPRTALRRLREFDAVFLRVPTDPENAAFAWSRAAELHGLPVLDDARSILVCSDKVHMHGRLALRGVPTPCTLVLRRSGVTHESASAILADMGPEVVLKAPHSSFSSHVEKVRTADDFVRVAERFLHRADRIVVQEFVPSEFDWRVGVLAGAPLYACRYRIPKGTFKILDVVDGEEVVCWTEGVPVGDVPPAVMRAALDAAAAIGGGLYGVDLKESGGRVVVIEVNDNPTIGAGLEDQCAPDLYDRVVAHLAREREPAAVPAR